MSIPNRYTQKLFALLMLVPSIGFSQVTITGPDCVILCQPSSSSLL